MKSPISQERIIKTIENVKNCCERKTNHDRRVVESVALLGFKFVAGEGEISRTDVKKFQLELNLLQSSTSLTNLRIARNRFFCQITRFAKKRDKIFDIQNKYNVSSLIESETILGELIVSHLWCHEDLNFIPSDIPRLHFSKLKLFDAWINYVASNNLKIHVRDREWVESSAERAIAALPFYEWANVWENVSYISPSRLKSQGFDEVRTEPKYTDDEKRWEVNLFLGSGLLPDSPDESIWFSAFNRCR